MATAKDTSTFFLEADSKQFDSVLKYQNELPKKIKSRGKDAHMIHEELVQLMKWKQARGRFYPQLSYLIKVNTPRAVMQETKKAFKKLPNIESAMTALSNLKGVGTATASALLAAASPEIAPFMADECIQAIPEMEGSDYTAKEYLNFVKHIRNVCDRLNKEQNGCGKKWSPHMVELALWTHNIVSDLQPQLLGKEPVLPALPEPTNGGSPLPSDESNLEPPATNGNGKLESVNEDTTTSCTEDSMDAKAASPGTPATPASPSDNSDSAVSTPRAKRSRCRIGKLESVNEDTTTSCTEDSMDAKAASPGTPATPATPASPSDNSDSAVSTPRAKRQIEEASSAEENSLGETPAAEAPPMAKKLREATH
ncbi:hypothetical protein RR48_12945 [Papilio machaon]|uniref:Uncharacterized protein n=1 Tax=Papilio machaon TaxID=76193 RepID=A0A194QXA4_PAPMA|nr:hypothetical protein RR48_12945 [Papilio machaon]